MVTSQQYRWVGLSSVFVIGLIVGWLARPLEPAPDNDPATQLPLPSRQMPPAPVLPTSSRPATETPRQSGEISSLLSAATPRASGGREESATPAYRPAADPNTGLPSGVNIGASQTQGKKALDDLMGAISISCQYDAGQGAAWRGNSYSIMSASWQGGLVVYDSMDFSESSARMTGSEGATGSNTGETKMRVAVTDNGLHFTSFNPRGDLVSTTVFPVTDKQGRYIAVMSTHSREFNHYSSQFYGLCDTLP
jgi:hypothetical protein